MGYTKIDLSRWDRGDLFQFYMQHMRVVMSLTADLDVTPLIRSTRRTGLNFYAAMVWAVSKVVNAHDEFKYGWDDSGDLIRWDVISPSYARFHVCISRSRAVVARLVHTQEAAGSSPASATSPLWGILSPSLHGGLVFAPAFNLPTRPPLLGDIAQLAERWLCKP